MTLALSNNSLTVLSKRYLLPDETPEQLFWRVARAIAEPEEDKEFYSQAFYNMMANLDFLPNSPTLFNAGTNQGTMSACFKLNIPDSMDGIMEIARISALLQKWGGGVGYVFSDLRPKGAPVKTTQRYAGGPVAFMKLYHGVATAVTQGGKRDGAQMAILHVDHPDIHEFINCKNNDPQSLSTFNISVAVTDEAMRNRKDIILEMAESAWKTGDPGCYFIDTAERSNPTPQLGKLDGVNPCGEVCLLDRESCNLGSINLNHLVYGGDIDWDRLGETVKLAVRFLDNVVTVNEFPDPSIKEANLRTRKIGLGVMGWADMLALLGIHYDTDEAVELGRKVMAFINDTAREESTKLSLERGVFPAWDGDFQAATRNATRTCIAPTGTISILADASSGIEPHFALTWDRVMGDGTILPERIPVMNLLNGFIPKTALEIDWQWHIKHQAAFQENTDLAVSKTINMPESATVQDIYDAYIMAWQLGCKGTTIYRDRSRDVQVLNISDNNSNGSISTGHNTSAQLHLVDWTVKKRPDIVHGYTRHIQSPEGKINLTINSDDDGPTEVFINVGKAGSDILALAEAIGRLISLNLRLNSPVTQNDRMAEIVEQLGGIGGSKEIGFGNGRVRSLPDAISKALSSHLESTRSSLESPSASLASEPSPIVHPGRNGRTSLCPDCGNHALSFEEGCFKCHSCGYSQC